ncbi:MAG: hypothetical protein P3X24_010025 [bacterium]|nr:hypothetical protein [bacterium]
MDCCPEPLLGRESLRPTLSNANLTSDPVVSSGLSFPIALEFLVPADPTRFVVIEKNSGRVKLVQNGGGVSTVWGLPVNYASERGLSASRCTPTSPTTASYICTARAPT